MFGWNLEITEERMAMQSAVTFLTVFLCKNIQKIDRTLSAKPRSDNARQDRSNPRANNAMGNAFADALKNWKK